MIYSYFAMAMILIGVLFLTVGTLGVFRFEDVYMRLQSSSKSLTFGLIFTLFGVGLLSEDINTCAKAILTIIFQFLTAPIAAHIIARVALRQGHTPAKLRGTLRPDRSHGDD